MLEPKKPGLGGDAKGKDYDDAGAEKEKDGKTDKGGVDSDKGPK